MFEFIKIENLRGINKIEVNDFRQINLFVGKNNSCKTTILEGIFLVTGASNPMLPLNINLFRNLNPQKNDNLRFLFHELDINKKILIKSRSSVNNETRLLEITPNRENSTSSNVKKINISVNSALDISKINNLGTMNNEAVENMDISGIKMDFNISSMNINKKISTFAKVNETALELSGPQDYKDKLNGAFIHTSATSNGNAQRLEKLIIKKENHKIVEVLKEIEPKIQNILVGIDQAILCDIGLETYVPINILGDGINRVLSIILAIFDCKNGVVMLDEIENGFHYSALEILWRAIFKAALDFNVQVFISTHSMECVKAFNSINKSYNKDGDLTRLYRIEKRDEDFRIIKYNHNILNESLQSGWEVR